MGTAYFAEDWKVVLAAEGVGAISTLVYLLKVKSPWKQVRETLANHTKLSAEADKIKQEAELWAEEYREAQTVETAQRKAQLEEIVDNLETAIREAQEAAQAQLEEQKEQIFNQANQAIAQKDSQIQELYEYIEMQQQQLLEAKHLIHELELPQLPEGFNQETNMARAILLILRKAGIICEYKGAWCEGDWIYVRVNPRTGGASQMTKHLEWIQRELGLPEKPTVAIAQGTVQFTLRNPTILNVSPVVRHQVIEPEIEPEQGLLVSGVNTTNLLAQQGFEPEQGKSEQKQGKFEHVQGKSEPQRGKFGFDIGKSEPQRGKFELERGKFEQKEGKSEQKDWSYLADFVEPSYKFDPYGEIRQQEIDWVVYLKLFCGYTTPAGRHKEGLGNVQIIKRVWNANRGGTERYRAARARLGEILGEAGFGCL